MYVYACMQQGLYTVHKYIFNILVKMGYDSNKTV